MSANNILYINKDTYEVFYQGCADNEGYGEKIGQGKTLEEAIDIAENYLGDGYLPEYGINFISSKKKMTDREEFEQFIAYQISPRLSEKDIEELYSWFQSKQQEKIEEIKKLRKGKGGTKYGIWADGYLDAIKKVLEILEK